MIIIASQIASATIQIDGRTQVRETHIADDGRQWTVDYLAPVGADLSAALAARALWLQSLPAEEQPAAQQMLLKLKIIRRMTDDELATFQTYLTSSARAQAEWTAAVVIDPDDMAVRGPFEAAYGAQRAAQILAVP